MITLTNLLDAIDVVGAVPCHSAPDLYSVDEDVPSYLTLMTYARDLCATCPVIEVCRRYALENDEAFGVWGGLSASQRNKINRGKLTPPLIAPVSERELATPFA